jgi:hypothetical protein
MGFRRYVSVDIDPDDVLGQMDTKEVVELFEQHFPRQSVIVRQGMGDGDKPLSRFIEDAYLAAKAMPDCPPAIRDLLWHVHGRAI